MHPCGIRPSVIYIQHLRPSPDFYHIFYRTAFFSPTVQPHLHPSSLPPSPLTDSLPLNLFPAIPPSSPPPLPILLPLSLPCTSSNIAQLRLQNPLQRLVPPRQQQHILSLHHHHPSLSHPHPQPHPFLSPAPIPVLQITEGAVSSKSLHIACHALDQAPCQLCQGGDELRGGIDTSFSRREGGGGGGGGEGEGGGGGVDDVA